MSRPEKRKTPGKKMMTTTYKKGGTVKKAKGGKVTRKLKGGGQGYNARLDDSMEQEMVAKLNPWLLEEMNLKAWKNPWAKVLIQEILEWRLEVVKLKESNLCETKPRFI